MADIVWPIQILLVEDWDPDAELVKLYLNVTRKGDYLIERTLRLDRALNFLGKGLSEIVLLDLNLPDSRGLDSFIKVRETFPRIPIVILTSLVDERLAQAALKGGAQDYLVKGFFDGPTLDRVIRYAVERNRLQLALVDQLEREVRSLRGLLPACAVCGKIRDRTTNNWMAVELYLERYGEINFSHGLCPDCIRDQIVIMLKDDPKLDAKAIKKAVGILMGDKDDPSNTA